MTSRARKKEKCEIAKEVQYRENREVLQILTNLLMRNEGQLQNESRHLGKSQIKKKKIFEWDCMCTVVGLWNPA